MQEHNRHNLENAQQRWEHGHLAPALGTRQRQTMPSELPQKSLYTPLDTTGMDYMQELSFPGDYPYTRGIYPSMYQGRLWTMRQYAGFGTPEETHDRFRYLLDQGQGGLLVALTCQRRSGWIRTTRELGRKSAWSGWR